MSQARKGDTVKVHFTGRLENGEVFSKPKEDEPFEFTLGSGELIPGFEKGIVGMEVGETKTITAPPEEAFGGNSSIIRGKCPCIQTYWIPAFAGMTGTYPILSFPRRRESISYYP